MGPQFQDEDTSGGVQLTERQPSDVDMQTGDEQEQLDLQDGQEVDGSIAQEGVCHSPQDTTTLDTPAEADSDHQEVMHPKDRTQEPRSHEAEFEERAEARYETIEPTPQHQTHGDRRGQHVEHSTEAQRRQLRQVRSTPRPQSAVYTAEPSSRNIPIQQHPGHTPEALWLDLQNEIHILRGQLRQSQDSLSTQNKAFHGEFHRLTGQLQESQQTVEALQKPMLLGRDRFQPCEDNVFREMMTSLIDETTKLSRNMKDENVMSKNELKGFIQDNMFTVEVDEWVWRERSLNKRLFEAAVWFALYSTLFEDPFQVYGEAGNTAMRAWEALFGRGIDEDSCLEVPPTYEASERWRSLTAIQLHQSSYGRAQKCEALLEQLQNSLSERLRPLSNPKKGIKSWNIRKVVEAAARLASNMAQQRCRIELFRPNVAKLEQLDVDALCRLESVVDIGGSRLGKPLFLVIPGLRKWGNGWGQNLEERTLMWPASLASEAEDY